MSLNAREAILAAAKSAAQHHGYNGINFRSIADEVGIKNASIYYHFASKANLGAAVANRYWQDTAQNLKTIREQSASPDEALQRYPQIFRMSLEDANRLCLSSFMAAEYDDLPEEVKREVQCFVEANVEWLTQVLNEKEPDNTGKNAQRGLAIYTAVAGAQLIARTRQDINLFDSLIMTYQETGLIPLSR
ncbi:MULTISPECIES: TetR/AcrR family transcriptional regulator [Pantoea]|uniref:TetR/AcrR family transcriptional regulator n=1 Tax=Pantoea TaxID=53335 RepID=UPI00057FD7E2|nr:MULTISPECIES: TetR/AcrR family transcriptional regulator [Pantoea]QXG56776.1 TetR/AcrR family transcriptional regulator [Pantoea jilinensis]TPD90285.1 TetR/AcrR family transcriptional regulator [Pantoea vagans]